MKFTKYALLAAGCVMMASCSSDEPALDGQNPADTPSEGVSGYAQFSIKLPQTSGFSRDVNYEEGTSQEYAVANGMVLVFKKAATEAAATFVCPGDLNGMRWSDPTTGEITTTASPIAKLSDIDVNNANVQYAAVIVLNYNDDFKLPAKDQSFGDWSKQAQSGSMILRQDGKDFITMSNAAKYISSSVEPTILVDIDKDAIAQTSSDIKKPAATVHVQRALAKVTVSLQNEYTVPEGNEGAGDKVNLTDWALDITNKTSFPVQVTDGLKADFAEIWNGGTDGNLYRFFGTGAFPRAYWAKDPNYNQDITNQSQIEANFNVINNAEGKPEALYCLENTFDVDHMMQGQTTRVVLKGTYHPAGVPDGQNFFTIGISKEIYTESGEHSIEKAIAKKAPAGCTIDLGAVLTAPGYHSLKEVSIKQGDNRLDDAAYDKIAEDLGMATADEKGIATYAQGTVFYIARIKHFGDTDCPWKLGQNYDSDNKAFLGRYGMVRNNWYEVSIDKVTQLGTPIVPPINPTTPDDENNYYIKVTVNMLSWAKRVQNVDL